MWAHFSVWSVPSSNCLDFRTYSWVKTPNIEMSVFTCLSSHLGFVSSSFPSKPRWSAASIYTKRWWWTCERPPLAESPSSPSTLAFLHHLRRSAQRRLAKRSLCNSMEVFSLFISISLWSRFFFSLFSFFFFFLLSKNHGPREANFEVLLNCKSAITRS